jgi:hypothetical protein
MKLNIFNVETVITDTAERIKQEAKAKVEQSDIQPHEAVDYIIDVTRGEISLRFIALSSGDGEINVTLFDPSIEHTAMLPPRSNGDFIGAGEFKKGLADWDSPSCETNIGYDRPPDTEQGNEILQEIDTLVEDWIRNVLNPIISENSETPTELAHPR